MPHPFPSARFQVGAVARRLNFPAKALLTPLVPKYVVPEFDEWRRELFLPKHLFNPAKAPLPYLNGQSFVAVRWKDSFSNPRPFVSVLLRSVSPGLRFQLDQLADIQDINRFTEPPPSGPMCDLLWADPIENYDDDHDETFVPNQMRGCSYCYTFNAVNDFLNANKLLSVIRAHEAQDAGFRMHKKTQKGFPSVITIFSAPNYLDAYNNKGAILRYENDVLNIRQFSHSPHPYWLPSFMDVFTWSMPFVAEKLAEILLVFLNIVDDKEEEELEQKEARRSALRAKIQSVSRLMRMYSAVRNERDQAMTLGPLLPNGVQSPEPVFNDVVVRHGSDPSKLSLSFAQAKATDKPNERRPPFKGGLGSSTDSIQKAMSLPPSLLLARFRGQPSNSPSSSL